MPRQRLRHGRAAYVFPGDLPQPWSASKEASALSWAEMDRRLGTDPHTIRRWRDEGVRPSVRHFAALLNLANDLGLGHLFTG